MDTLLNGWRDEDCGSTDSEKLNFLQRYTMSLRETLWCRLCSSTRKHLSVSGTDIILHWSYSVSSQRLLVWLLFFIYFNIYEWSICTYNFMPEEGIRSNYRWLWAPTPLPWQGVLLLSLVPDTGLYEFGSELQLMIEILSILGYCLPYFPSFSSFLMSFLSLSLSFIYVFSLSFFLFFFFKFGFLR